MTSILHLAAVVGVGLGLLTFVILALSGLAAELWNGFAPGGRFHAGQLSDAFRGLAEELHPALR